MIALFLSIAMALQGVPVRAQQVGTVSGVLKDARGNPLPSIRIAAIARTESLDEVITSPSMASLAETDEEGRYTLTSIPPGRYFIAAGRLDEQTFYPGTTDVTLAKEVAITPGVVVSGIDFTLGDSSFGRASSFGFGGGPGASARVPLRVTVDGGGKLPLSTAGKFTTLKLDGGDGAEEWSITGTAVMIPPPSSAAYRVTVENLPESYAVKSITYGTTDLQTNTLQLGVLNLPGPSLTSQFGFPPEDPAALRTYMESMRGLLTRYPAATVQGLQAAAAAFPQDPGLHLLLAAPGPPQTPPSILQVTLTSALPKAIPGARVSGRLSFRELRTIHLSGIPGTVYSDASFEVFGVPPGRHLIVTRENPRGGLGPLAASIVVGDRDLDGVTLADTLMLPPGAWEPSPPRPAGGRPAGNVPLARFSGTLVEEVSRKPITDGKVILASGSARAAFPVDPQGRFELPPLLPGTYDFEVVVFGHSSVKQSFEIDDKDVKIELAARRLY